MTRPPDSAAGTVRCPVDPVAAAIAAGDEEALRCLVFRLHPKLVRFARSIVDADGAAEEVVQEAWVVVLRSAGSFEGRSSLDTWIFAIVRNLARKELASRVRRRTHERPHADEVDPLEGRFYPRGHPSAGHWAVPPETRFLPEAHLDASELAEVLRRAIDALPRRQRQVVVLRDVAGLEAAEVERLLGIGAGNQRTLLHRARGKLRAELERSAGRAGAEVGHGN